MCPSKPSSSGGAAITASTNVLPQSAPACLVRVDWSLCPALGVLLGASMGLGTEAASPWIG